MNAIFDCPENLKKRHSREECRARKTSDVLQDFERASSLQKGNANSHEKED